MVILLEKKKKYAKEHIKINIRSMHFFLSLCFFHFFLKFIHLNSKQASNKKHTRNVEHLKFGDENHKDPMEENTT